MDAESIIDQLVPCSGPVSGGTWKNHGQYVSSVAHAAQNLANLGCISQPGIGQIVSEAARSDCGKSKNGAESKHGVKSKKGAKSKNGAKSKKKHHGGM
jgi:hypothetical protein